MKINSLSMVAEDHADSAKNAAAIYNVIREPLISISVHSDRKLPLVYVVDSILKNVKGEYIPIIEKDAKEWMPVVYKVLAEDKRAKLKKVWNLWRDAGVFSSKESWEEMGRCFSSSSAIGGDSKNIYGSGDEVANPTLEKAGITFGVRLLVKHLMLSYLNVSLESRSISMMFLMNAHTFFSISGRIQTLLHLQKDGSLKLMPSLRNAMQSILDDLQSDEQDELNKVSLERLAAIDGDLLVKIKKTAEDAVRNGTSNSNGPNPSSASQSGSSGELAFLVETRTPEAIELGKTWEKLKLDYKKDAHNVIASLQQLVLRASTTTEKRYTQSEAMEMTGALATAAVTASILTNYLQEIKDEEDSRKKKSKLATSGNQGLNGPSGSAAPSFFAVDKGLFTNDGIKILNEAIVGLLYDVGLPFISSADGRRFASQQELSKHLDALFKKGQLEKTMATTQERGWYVYDAMWSGEPKAQDPSANTAARDDQAANGPAVGDDNADPDTFTMPADENRDRCVVCGINFKMYFDNDDGIYKYTNCRGIEVLTVNDDVAFEEWDEMLVHVSCWRNLGSPDQLTAEQTLQDAIRS